MSRCTSKTDWNYRVLCMCIVVLRKGRDEHFNRSYRFIDENLIKERDGGEFLHCHRLSLSYSGSQRLHAIGRPPGGSVSNLMPELGDLPNLYGKNAPNKCKVGADLPRKLVRAMRMFELAVQFSSCGPCTVLSEKCSTV